MKMKLPFQQIADDISPFFNHFPLTYILPFVRRLGESDFIRHSSKTFPYETYLSLHGL